MGLPDFGSELRGESIGKSLMCSQRHRNEIPHIQIQGKSETSASECYPNGLCEALERVLSNSINFVQGTCVVEMDTTH